MKVLGPFHSGSEVPGNERARERMGQGPKRLGSESSRQQDGQGANRPGSKRAKERIGRVLLADSLRGANWPVNEKNVNRHYT